MCVPPSSYSTPGWPDEFVKKRRKCGTTHFVKTNTMYVTQTGGKKHNENLGYFCIHQKTAQRKQWPNKLKFAQSGHPALR
jgi:hypothetical protein